MTKVRANTGSIYLVPHAASVLATQQRIHVTQPSLRLLSSTPAREATGVSRTQPLVLNFSAPLNPQTVDWTHVQLGSLGINEPVTFTVSGSQVTMTPSTPLEPSTPYTITVRNVRGSGREEMSEAIEVNFTTDAASWQTPQAISEGGRPHFYSSSISSRGDKFAAVWRHENDTLALRRYAPRTGWNDLAFLRTNTRSFISDLQVFLDEAGTAHAIYNNNLERLELSRHTLSNGWSPVEEVATDGSGRIATWQGGMDAAGNIIIVWSSVTSEDNYNIWANCYVPGSGWGTPVHLNHTDRCAVQPKLAVNAAGYAMAIWQQDHYGGSDSYAQLWSRRYTPGSGWEPAHRVDDGGTVSAEEPQIALDYRGNAVAVYTRGGNVMANSYDRTAGWGTPVAIENLAGAGFGPQVAFDSFGSASVSWVQAGASSSHEIYCNRRLDNSWGAAELIARATREYRDLRLVIDSGGSEMLVVTDVTAMSSSILAIRNVPCRGWVWQPLDLRLDANSRSKPQLATDASGSALAIWFGRYPDTNTVEASVFE